MKIASSNINFIKNTRNKICQFNFKTMNLQNLWECIEKLY